MMHALRISTSPLLSGIAVFGTLACFALWMDFSAFHEHQHADSIVPILVSLQRWTPFFWQQDRLGMLVPLLATPIRSPLANLLFQNWLNILLGLGSFAMLARYLLPRNVDWALPAGIAAGLFIALVNENERFDVFSGCQPYAASLTVGLFGLQFLRADLGPLTAARIAVCVVSALVAQWINLGVILLLGPLAVGRGLLEGWPLRAGAWRRGAGSILGVFILLAGTAAWRKALRWVAPPGPALFPTGPAIIPLRAWPAHTHDWVLSAWEKLAPHHWEGAALLAAAIGLAAFARSRQRSGARPFLLASGGLLVSATFCFFVTGVLNRISDNDYPLRYAVGAMITVSVSLGLLAAIPVRMLIARVAYQRSLAAIGTALGILLSYGLPGPGHLEQALDRRWGEATREAIDVGATHFAGDYWDVWPMVLRANSLHYERGDGLSLFGLANRAEVTIDLARQVPPERMCVALLHGQSATNYIDMLGQRRWGAVTTTRTLDVIRPTP